MSDKSGKVQDLIDKKFLEERKVFLNGQVDGKSAKHIIDRLMYLDMESNDEIQFYINSPGGYVTDGFAIYDTMKGLKKSSFYNLFWSSSFYGFYFNVWW